MINTNANFRGAVLISLQLRASHDSMGFHAPQEAARILGEAIDYARQGEVALLKAIGFARAAD